MLCKLIQKHLEYDYAPFKLKKRVEFDGVDEFYQSLPHWVDFELSSSVGPPLGWPSRPAGQ